MKRSILWLFLAIFLTAAGVFLLSTLRRYLTDAKNAQG